MPIYKQDATIFYFLADSNKLPRMENKRWVLTTVDNGVDKTNYVHQPEILRGIIKTKKILVIATNIFLP
ncbi:MAG: hypothetical protein RR938_04745 [Muribaculaceae bacterium]